MKLLKDESRIADVVAPTPGATLSQDGSTAVVLAGAGADTNEMVRVATDLKEPIQDLSVTMAILVLALGALVAAGLPLGVPRVEAAGDRRDHGHRRQGSAAVRAHGAGLAVRSDAGALTLLPLVLFKLDMRINTFSLPWVHIEEHRSFEFAAWGERLWKRPLAWGLASLIILLALAAPVLGLKTAMPSIKVLPEDASARVGYDVVQDKRRRDRRHGTSGARRRRLRLHVGAGHL